MLKLMFVLIAAITMQISHSTRGMDGSYAREFEALVEEMDPWSKRLGLQWERFNVADLRNFIERFGNIQSLPQEYRNSYLTMYVSMEGRIRYLNKVTEADIPLLSQGITEVDQDRQRHVISKSENREEWLAHLIEIRDAKLLDALNAVGIRRGITAQERLDRYNFMFDKVQDQMMQAPAMVNKLRRDVQACLGDGPRDEATRQRVLLKVISYHVTNIFPGIALVKLAAEAELAERTS